METLVLSQDRIQYCARSRVQIVGSDGFGSPSRGFQEINCRTFQSSSASSPRGRGGAGILPSPTARKPSSFICTSSEPLAISPPATTAGPNEKQLKCGSNPIPIKTTTNGNGNGASGRDSYLSGCTVNDDPSSYPELWAGPAYSNSPPPSSLPIPNFSLRQKRSNSLEIPPSPSHAKFRPVPKSAPSSPTRGFPLLAKGFFIYSTASATESLRRILHLDIPDDCDHEG